MSVGRALPLAAGPSRPRPRAIRPRPPTPAGWVDDVEVIGAGELEELGVRVARGVVAALRGRDDVVGVAVDEELRHAERGERRRRGHGVALGRRRRTSRAGPRPRRRRGRPARRARGRRRRPARPRRWAAPGSAPGALPRRRGRAASQSARWPPAEWPHVTTRDGSTSSSSARWSIAAATSSSVPGQPPPSCPTRRYSTFQAAIPRRARSMASGVISVRSQPVRQNPPWIRTTHGQGRPSPAGRWRFATWSGWSPYAMHGAGRSLWCAHQIARAVRRAARGGGSASRSRSTSSSTL